jgi:hypothetical protein
MNAIGGFSAPLNGVRLAEMSSRQKQETRGGGLNGTTSVEDPFQAGRLGMKRGDPVARIWNGKAPNGETSRQSGYSEHPRKAQRPQAE